jgi:hypothetical protein
MWHIWKIPDVHTGLWWADPIGKIPCGRPRYKWEDNVKMDLQKVGWDGTDRTDLSQDRYKWWMLVNAVMNLLVP